MTQQTSTGHVGDWIEVHFMAGGPPRRGQIVEVLGTGSHEHYRVRWMDDHESLFFPADGTHIRHSTAPPRG
jgi:hypothetical protein